MMVPKIVMAVILLVGSGSSIKWHNCPPIHLEDGFNKTAIQPKQRQSDRAMKQGCNFQGGGGTNWNGVMSGIGAFIPGLNLINGINGIFSNVDFSNDGSSSTEAINECVRNMIGHALEDHDLDECRQYLLLIQGHKEEFLKLLHIMDQNEEVISEDVDSAERHIDFISNAVNQIKVKFASTTGEKHHEKFLPFYLEAVAMEASANILLLGNLDSVGYVDDKDDVCRRACKMDLHMTSRIDQVFEDENSGFHMKDIMQSYADFNNWPNTCRYYYLNTPLDSLTEMKVEDQYRDMFCEQCCWDTQDPSYDRNYCCTATVPPSTDGGWDNPCSTSHVPQWTCGGDDTAHDTSENCIYCQNYATKQIEETYALIDEAYENVKNILKTLKSIVEENHCPPIECD